ncbi:MAG: Isoleucine-tRNA ligase [Candidatus Kaiserbacteria bacterium GW2011_GWA2_58_9]|nr:MAG: Isoleucine-tRNA ligase [Candidatus Kaiserbacteria bacterium GW2011_GWA2_58_9]
MAPTMPFFAEHLFQVVLEEKDEESVHLATWPESRATLNFIQNMFGLGGEDKKLLAGMRAAREMVTRALEARQKAGIKVRQPLRQLTVNSEQLTDALKIIVRDEINVKDVVVSNAIPAGTIELDTDITPELREEGVVRDTIRLVQDARKAANMRPGEHGSVSIAVSSEDRPTIERNLAHIQKQTNTAIALS